MHNSGRGRARLDAVAAFVIASDRIASARRVENMVGWVSGTAPHVAQACQGALKSIGDVHRVICRRYMRLVRELRCGNRPLQI
eukprot:298819-Prymnesium_polylepis.1